MKTNKNIILSLIKDDLTNTQLIDGLNTLGLDAGKYYLNISQSFFALMGFGNYDQDTKLYIMSILILQRKQLLCLKTLNSWMQQHLKYIIN